VRNAKAVGIVAFVIALGWVGYFYWCSSHRTFSSTVKSDAGGVLVWAEKDCASVLKMVSNVQLQSNELSVRLIDLTSHRDIEHLTTLARPVCLSLYGARLAATLAGEDTTWFNRMPFFLVDAIEGATDQAQFRREMIPPWSTGESRYVLVASGIFATYTNGELVWTLGHELGHGVFGHSMKRKPIVAVAISLMIVGFCLAWRRTPVRRTVGAVVILAGAVFLLTGHALFSKAHEMEADVFGVDAAALAGAGSAPAKAAALSVLIAHPMAEESWCRCGGLNLNVHPSTVERKKNIENM